MPRPYKNRAKGIQFRQGNGRFRKANLQDFGIPQSSLQDGSAICANCGYGKEELWYPVLKTGYCPKCKCQEKE